MEISFAKDIANDIVISLVTVLFAVIVNYFLLKIASACINEGHYMIRNK